MKKITRIVSAVFIFTFVVGFLTACNSGITLTSLLDDNLIFSDDFDTLNGDIWNVYTKNILDADGNITESGYGYDAILENGLRKGGYWDKEQVFVKDGNLVLRTSEKDGKYYTGAIDTNNKFETHYGYYESRVYLPKAYGIWSAFWIMCDKMGTASTDAKVAGTEIDIFETPFYSGTDNQYDIYQSALHIGDYSNDNSAYYTKPWINILNNKRVKIYDDWHIFALDWQEDYYKFYLDGNLMWETDLDGNISNQDSFLFLSVEIDGANGSAYKNIFSFMTKDISENAADAFPSDFLVDYVRVYKTKP